MNRQSSGVCEGRESRRVQLLEKIWPNCSLRGRKLEKVYRLDRKKRRGASAVEFALVAPVFILLVFGMIEFGRMVMVQQLLTNASREGARRAVLDGSTVDDVKSLVQQYLTDTSVTVPLENISVTPDPTTAEFGDPITVSVSVAYPDVSWLPAPMFLGETNMEASTVMRRETVQ